MLFLHKKRFSLLHPDLVIKSLSAQHHDLLYDVQLFAQLRVDGDVIERTEPVDREPSKYIWKLKGAIEVSVTSSVVEASWSLLRSAYQFSGSPYKFCVLFQYADSLYRHANIPLFTIEIVCESAIQGTRPLGFIKLTSGEILAQSVEQRSGMHRVWHIEPLFS